MKPGIVNDTTKSGKNLAKQIAKQIAQEPFEMAKTAGRQIGGTEGVPGQQIDETPREATGAEPTEVYKQKKAAQSQRLMQALRTELSEIKQKGEQKEAQKAQIEEVQEQQKKEIATQNPAPQISSKPSRRFGPGQKQAAKQQTTHVEKPVQSST